MRQVLESSKVNGSALKAIENFHSGILEEVKSAIQKHKVVVIGMRQNPVVKKARNLLAEKNIPFEYLEYGSYFSQWKPRLAIKLWSGWPTFPQVFIDGQLIGGAEDLEKYLKETPRS